jgi:predicted ester cyclase
VRSQDMEAIARRLVEVGIGGGDAAVIDELVDPDGIEHQRGHGPGVAGAHRLSADLHRRLSGLEIRVEDAVVDGDRVWLRSRARGISSGPFLGLPPTGRPVEVEVFDICRIRDGRIVEHWGLADQMGLLLQLGFEPVAASSAASAASASGAAVPA